MIEQSLSVQRTRRLVIIDAVGRWKHDMFSKWNFGELLLIKPREIRAHFREVTGGRRFRLSPREIASGVWELNLPMPPGWLFPLLPVSARILASAVRRFVGDQPWSLVLTLPQYHAVIEHLPRERGTVAYYAYDDYTENWPGRARLVEEAEREMSRKADIILCAAAHRLREFADSRAAQKGRVHQLPVAAPDEWLVELEQEPSAPSPVSRQPSPRFLSFGALTGRIDFRWFAAVARRFPAGSVILAGNTPHLEQGDAEWRAEATACLALPNVHCTGWVSEQDRGAVLRSADVFLMAHSACRFNLGSCPAKLWDYFAVGRPVVVTPNCPEVLSYPHLIYCGSDPESYADAATRALQEDSADKRLARRTEAQKHSASAVADQAKRYFQNP